MPTSPPPPLRPAQLHTLFVWDYDRTIVLDDTDVAAVRAVAPDLLPTLDDWHLIESQTWLAVVNSCLAAAAARGRTVADVERGASDATLPRATADALRRIAASPYAASAIASDSNTTYIHASLQRHALSNVCAAGIYSNVGTVDSATGAVQVRGYTQATGRPHNCTSCDRRLCKGVVVAELRTRIEEEAVRAGTGREGPLRIVYVGDGGNDYCPVSKLGADDVVLFRKGYPLERRIRKHGGVLARARGWETPEQLSELVHEIVAEVEAAATRIES